jgi:hypothetical protein
MPHMNTIPYMVRYFTSFIMYYCVVSYLSAVGANDCSAKNSFNLCDEQRLSVFALPLLAANCPADTSLVRWSQRLSAFHVC